MEGNLEKSDLERFVSLLEASGLPQTEIDECLKRIREDEVTAEYEAAFVKRMEEHLGTLDDVIKYQEGHMEDAMHELSVSQAESLPLLRRIAAGASDVLKGLGDKFRSSLTHAEDTAMAKIQTIREKAAAQEEAEIRRKLSEED